MPSPEATSGNGKAFLLSVLGNLHSALVTVQSIMNEASMTLKDESNEAGRVSHLRFIYLYSH